MLFDLAKPFLFCNQLRERHECGDVLGLFQALALGIAFRNHQGRKKRQR